MNTIISVHQQDLKNIEVVYTTVYSAVTALRPVEWPEVFTVRHLIPGSPTVSYTFRPNFRKNYVDVDYCMEGSAVFNDGFVPSFHFRFHDANDLSQHGNPILQTPKDPFVDEWLRQPNPQITGGLSSTYRYLQVLYFMCSTVFSYFPECFNLQSESNHERKYAALGNMINIAKGVENQHRVGHMYDGWDKVCLSEDEYEQVLWFVYTEKQKGTIPTGHSLKNIALPRFALRVESDRGLTSVYYFSLEDGKLNVVMDKEQVKSSPDACVRFCAEEKTFLKDDVLQSAMFLQEDGLSKSRVEWLHSPVSDVNNSLSIFDKLMQAFFLVNDFLSMPKSELNYQVEERECKASGKSKPSSSKSEHKVRTVKTYTLRKSFVASFRRKPVVYTCASWGVKGHTRRLRDGRTIFVKPYVKGRDRANYIGKEYILKSPLG